MRIGMLLCKNQGSLFLHGRAVILSRDVCPGFRLARTRSFFKNALHVWVAHSAAQNA